MSTLMAVSAEWSKSGTILTTNSRVTVDEGPVAVGPLQYQTSLLLNSLDKTRDMGNYTCTVHVIHSLEGFQDAVTDTAVSRFITVQSKSNPSNIIDTSITISVHGPYLMNVDAFKTFNVCNNTSLLLLSHILRSDVD